MRAESSRQRGLLISSNGDAQRLSGYHLWPFLRFISTAAANNKSIANYKKEEPVVGFRSTTTGTVYLGNGRIMDCQSDDGLKVKNKNKETYIDGVYGWCLTKDHSFCQ